MNIPNFITYNRLIFAVVALVFMLFDFWMFAFIFILLFWILDAVDGKLARKLKQVTDQGVFLDLMSDKFLMVSSFLIIGIKINMIFFYLALLMLLRDYIMDFLRSLSASKSHILSPDRIGKFKGILFIIAMMGMILNKALWSYDYFQTIMIVFGATGIVLGYITLVLSIMKNRKLLES